METGIYKITNLQENKRIYIGRCQTTFTERWDKHIYDLNRGKHINQELQADWNKYGAEAFKFEVYKRCDNVSAKYWELYYIDLFRHSGYSLYNVKSIRDNIILYVCNKLKQAHMSFEIDYKDDRCKGKKLPLHWQLLVNYNDKIRTYVHLYNSNIYTENQNADELKKNIQIRHDFIKTYEFQTIEQDISDTNDSNFTTIANQLYNEIMLLFWVFC